MLLVYDITNKRSYDSINNWLSEFKARNDKDSAVIYLLGNKSDLESERKVSYEQGRMLQEELKLDDFYECSAKDNSNIKEMFDKFYMDVYYKNKDKSNKHRQENKALFEDKQIDMKANCGRCC